MITNRGFAVGLALLCFSIAESARARLKLRHEDYLKYSKSVMAGARMGIAECDRQFKLEPWNCNLDSKTRLVPVVNRERLPLANKETAFVHAITTAGVMYSVILNCSLGQLENCRCQEPMTIRRKKAKSRSNNWQWGGCSDNVAFGDLVARNFVDALEGRRGDKGDARRLMNLHNNKVGRKMVKVTAKKVCRCFGSSSSCTQKICMRKLSTFDKIGDALRRKYEKAMHVEYRKGNLYNDKNQKVTKKKMKLVYFDKSPNYCKKNKKANIPGVEGRVCLAPDKESIKKCSKLCSICGLKAKIKMKTRVTKCNCRFVWCCFVKCDECKEKIKTVTCVR